MALSTLCLLLSACADSYCADGPQPVPGWQLAPLPPPLAPPLSGLPAEDGTRIPVAEPLDARYQPTIRHAYGSTGELPAPPDRGLPALPTTTAVTTTEPPPLPDRPPIPVPPDVSLPSLSAPVAPKQPLAWRAKAYTLSEKTAAAGGGMVSRTFDRPAEDVFSAIVAACPAAGLVIEALSSAAGDVLLAFADDTTGTSRIIISVRGAGPSRTTVRAILVPRGRAARQAVLEKLFSDIDLTLARNGAT